MKDVESHDADPTSPGTTSGRIVETLRSLVTPGWLEDARVLEYRHPSERTALAVALITLVAILAAGAIFGSKVVLIGVATIWLSMLLASSHAATLYTLSGAEVTPTQFPEIYTILQELRERFKAPPTRVFVVRKATVRPETAGLWAPYVIVLYSALLDSLEPDELRFVLGQQLGHIRFGHTRASILLGGDEANLPAVLAWITPARDLLFAWYWRAQALSADRAGLLACRSLRTAVRTHVKLAVGTNQLDQVQIADLVEQAIEVARPGVRRQAGLIHLRAEQPPLILRLAALVQWAARDDPDPLRRKAPDVDGRRGS
jgi:Zn-dependent protease with chaperone function